MSLSISSLPIGARHMIYRFMYQGQVPIQLPNNLTIYRNLVAALGAHSSYDLMSVRASNTAISVELTDLFWQENDFVATTRNVRLFLAKIDSARNTSTESQRVYSNIQNIRNLRLNVTYQVPGEVAKPEEIAGLRRQMCSLEKLTIQLINANDMISPAVQLQIYLGSSLHTWKEGLQAAWGVIFRGEDSIPNLSITIRIHSLKKEDFTAFQVLGLGGRVQVWQS